MQETAPGKLMSVLVEKMRDGTDLQTLVSAAALANARTFGGEDYIGFHTMMALAPAWHMSRELPEEQAALPVLKVLYRNSNRIQDFGSRKNEVLHLKAATEIVRDPQTVLRDTVRGKKKPEEAEAILSGVAGDGAQQALDAVLCMVEDATEVHRVVLPYRAWDLLPVIGKEHALTLLRQSVHYCVKAENNNWNNRYMPVRTMLPALLEKHKLLDVKTATAKRKADDAWVEQMSQTIFKAKPEDAAGAVAQALADGFDPADVGQAICLAANQLILRDNGRPQGTDRLEQAGRQRPRRFDRRPCLRLGQRLAEPGPRRHRPQQRRLPDPGGVPGGVRPRRPRRRLPQLAAVSARRGTREGQGGQPRQPAQGAGRRHQGEGPGAARRHWSIATANWGWRSGPVFDLLLRYAISRGRRAARREVLPHMQRGIRDRTRPAVPVAATDRHWPA